MNLEFDHPRIDFIGDIHGFGDELEALLIQLGYDLNSYTHPEERRIVFLGDYIDRGPKILKTLHLVKNLVDSGCAAAIMGNHEYNAIAINTLRDDSSGEYCRPHTRRNLGHYVETRQEFSQLPDQGASWLEWFKQLPLFIETDEFRAVHACWHPDLVSYWRQHRASEGITSEVLNHAASEPDDPLFDPESLSSQASAQHLDFWTIETLMKGMEYPLPEGVYFWDKSNTTRRAAVRIKWWEQTQGMNKVKDFGISLNEENPKNKEVLDTEIDLPNHFDLTQVLKEKPIFFGHYWLRGDEPHQLAPNAYCLDWSVAGSGFLCAYRMDTGEWVRV